MKLRRRLTVTGTNETIDGVSKLAVSEEFQKEEVWRVPRCFNRMFVTFSSVFVSFLCDSIMRMCVVPLQIMQAFRRKAMLLTILGKRIRMP